jgi:hypothetical protein
MSLKVIRLILESPGCAKGPAWALLVAMGNRASDDGTDIWESMGNLAKTCGISRSTAFKHLPELTKTGLVVDTGEMHDCGHGLKTVIYRIDISKLTKSVDATESVVETRSQERPSPQNDSTPSAPRTQTSPEPVQTYKEIDGRQTGSEAKTQAVTESQPKLVPVSYILPNSNLPREPEIEKLVEMFLNYQGNPGYNEKNTLLHWHSVLSRLRQTYDSLAAYMKFGFETDSFWSSGKLIRGKNSKGKDGKKYPDPIDYFEEMLPHIVTNFNRLEKGKAAAKARKPAAAAAHPAKPTRTDDEPLFDRLRLLGLRNRSVAEAKAYFENHRKEYEELHPEWLDDFKSRGIYD